VREGQRVDASWRLLARDAPVGWWSRVEFDGKVMVPLSGPLRYTASDGTTHVSCTLREERQPWPRSTPGPTTSTSPNCPGCGPSWLVSRSRAVLAPRRSSQLTTARGTRGSSSTPVYSTGTSRWTTPVVSRRLCGSSSAVVLLVGTALRLRGSSRCRGHSDGPLLGGLPRRRAGA